MSCQKRNIIFNLFFALIACVIFFHQSANAQSEVIQTENSLFLEISNKNNAVVYPGNVFVSNVSTTSFTLNWTTNQASVGAIIFGYSPEEITKMSLDKRDNKELQKPRYTHIVDIIDTSLSSEKSIYFQIIVDEEKFGPADYETFKFTPPKSLSSPPSPTSQDGTLVPTFETSSDLDDFIVACRINNDSLWASTTINQETKNFNIALGSVLNSDLTNYALSPEAYLNFFSWGSSGAHSRQDIQLSDEPISISIDKPAQELLPPQDPQEPNLPNEYIDPNVLDMNILPRTSIQLNSKTFKAFAFITLGLSFVFLFKLIKGHFLFTSFDLTIFSLLGSKKSSRLTRKLLFSHRQSFERKF